MSTATMPQTSRNVVTIGTNDPFDSVFEPGFAPESSKPRKPAFASAPIFATSKAQTFLPADTQPKFNDPLLQPYSTLNAEYVPKEEYKKAKRSARDAWFAVAILASFIAGGMYYIVDRIGGDANRIDDLTLKVDSLNGQLTSERSVVLARNQEIQLLNDKINEEHRKFSKSSR